MKESDNTHPYEIDILKNPATSTMLFRYELAASYAKNKDVLDASCGYGYGSVILKMLGAKSVVGTDIDKEALQFAKKNFNMKGIKFDELNLTSRVSRYNGKFDVVVSIETFEHLPDRKITTYLDNLYRALKKEGTIFITTPQRLQSIWKYEGGTHLKEYSLEEFATILYDFMNVTGVKYEMSIFSIDEIPIGHNQIVSVIKPTPRYGKIMCALIKVNKEE